MSSLRQVALYLHAIAPADQRWMLQRLPAEHEPALRAMLRELKAMGIPKNHNLLELESAQEKAYVNDAVPESAGNLLSRAKPAEVLTLLNGEPREVMAALLKAGEWKWQKELLQSYGPAERNWLSEHVASAKTSLPQAVKQSLVRLLERRLQNEFPISNSGDATKAESVSWWKRLKRGVPWRR